MSAASLDLGVPVRSSGLRFLADDVAFRPENFTSRKVFCGFCVFTGKMCVAAGSVMLLSAVQTQS